MKANIVFLTHVSYNRAPLLVANIDLLKSSLEQYRRRFGFKILAWVILPEHWHFLIDAEGLNIPDMMKRIKLSFAARYRERYRLRGARVWHNRYWDHIIRDQRDLNHHIDYIHYNPVKHGLVTATIDYPHSSFHEYLANGIYRPEWAMGETSDSEEEFGE